MAKKHVWRIKKEFFRQLRSGEKRIEVRVGYPQIKDVRKGDIITFENYGPNEFEVVRVNVYDSFKRMLEVEGCSKVLPGMTFTGAYKTFCEIYSGDKESLGVYVFELRPKNPNEQKHLSYEFFKASDLLKSGLNKQFSKLAAESYMLTDWMTVDFPEHCDNFYSKILPGIFEGGHEIISCYVNGKIVATAFLKTAGPVDRICAFYVKPEYVKQGIVTVLMEKCFVWFGTTKPLIVIPYRELPKFDSMIKKYCWTRTQILEAGQYSDSSTVYVFNGRVV